MVDIAGGIVKISVVENEVEAELLDSILAERSIAHVLRSYRDSAYDGIYQLQRGWGAVYAPSEFEAEILEIISDIRSGALPEACKADADVPRSQCPTQDDSVETGDGIDDGEHAEHSED